MVGLKLSTNTITSKFSKQSESALSDERFYETGFAFDVTHFGEGAQKRFFNIFSAYVAIMSEYYDNNFVPSNLVDIARMCSDILPIIQQHSKKELIQDTLPGMEYTAF